MEARELHRGRLIDHIGLVVRDLAASKACCDAVFGVLKIPMGGSDEHNFWADELFVSTPDSEAVQGELTDAITWRSRRKTELWWMHSTRLHWRMVEGTMALQVNAPTTLATTRRLS